MSGSNLPLSLLTELHQFHQPEFYEQLVPNAINGSPALIGNHLSKFPRFALCSAALLRLPAFLSALILICRHYETTLALSRSLF
jgi:hypothetical protein